MQYLLAAILGTFVLSAVLLGILAGIWTRKAKLHRIRRASVERPMYEVEDDLSPAEFGCVIDGAVGYKEVVGEVILLVRQGHLSLIKQPSGRVLIQKNHTLKGNLSPIQSAIMKEIGVNPQDIRTLQSIVEVETKHSLIRKGWIIDRKSPLRGISDAPWRPISIALAIIVVSVVGVIAVTSAMGYRDGESVTLAAMVAGVEILLAFTVFLAVLIRGELLNTARYVLSATNKYHEKWQNVHGVYVYISVSGMDVFTPDYETLNFDGLDSLYPYAVAAGLDKRILKVFA